MAFGKFLAHQQVVALAGNFSNNKDLDHLTDSITIRLSDLEGYIAELKEKYHNAPSLTGLRFYLVRYLIQADSPGVVAERIMRDKTNPNLSQPSIVAVPVKSFNPITGQGRDYVTDNPGEIYTLSFGDPTIDPQDDPSSLCPPKCNG